MGEKMTKHGTLRRIVEFFYGMIDLVCGHHPKVQEVEKPAKSEMRDTDLYEFGVSPTQLNTFLDALQRKTLEQQVPKFHYLVKKALESRDVFCGEGLVWMNVVYDVPGDWGDKLFETMDCIEEDLGIGTRIHKLECTDAGLKVSWRVDLGKIKA